MPFDWSLLSVYDKWGQSMGTYSAWHWVIVLIVGFVWIFPTWKILRRMGFTGWWALLSIVPGLNLVLLWVVSLVKWPIENQEP